MHGPHGFVQESRSASEASDRLSKVHNPPGPIRYASCYTVCLGESVEQLFELPPGLTDCIGDVTCEAAELATSLTSRPYGVVTWVGILWFGSVRISVASPEIHVLDGLIVPRSRH